MATDGPTPAVCDAKVFRKGEAVFLGWDISSNRMEGWVQQVAKVSGQRVDWSFFGGRAIVKALGDIQAVRDAIVLLRADYRELTIASSHHKYDGNDGKFM